MRRKTDPEIFERAKRKKSSELSSPSSDGLMIFIFTSGSKLRSSFVSRCIDATVDSLNFNPENQFVAQTPRDKMFFIKIVVKKKNKIK